MGAAKTALPVDVGVHGRRLAGGGQPDSPGSTDFRQQRAGNDGAEPGIELSIERQSMSKLLMQTPVMGFFLKHNSISNG